MRKFTIAAIAVLSIAGSGAVYAHYHRPWMHEHMRHIRMNPEDRAAMVDARIAAVHAGLKLNADQEKLWPPVEAAIRDLAKQRQEARQARRERFMAMRDQTERDVPGMLRFMADRQAASAESLRKLADASAPLYASLDDGQKRRMMRLGQGFMRMGEGRG